MHNFDLHHGELRRLDLNLLVAFDALMVERHVSRAASRLNLGQPAMSHVLSRLRETLGDPLFIRCGTRMEPTARALELAPRIREWLHLTRSLLLDETPFDPAQENSTFTLATPDGLEALIYPSLIASLRQQAPGILLRSYLLEVDQQLAALDRDEVDLLISATPLALRDWHSQRPLMDSRFVALYSRQQLTLPPHPTLADLASFDQIASSYRGNAAGVVDQLFADQHLTRRVVALSASLLVIGNILQQAPLLSIQPEIYLPLFETQSGIGHVVLDESLNIRINLVWHRRNDNQPLHRFLRMQVLQRLECLFGPLLP
jgi:DNA-binding transcriptional LysR family regulator